MELGKCHFFFSSGTMKFFLFLLFLLLLFGSLQGSTISHKRSVRALNTTLETNFNGTYEKINPCTNAEIERTSYVASHKFRHHTEENNWNDYTHKCSSIISNFLQALGNLVNFNKKQNGVFNFHISTTISQKQDGHSESDKRTSCDILPTLTIEATDCELSPILCRDNLFDGQLCKDQKEEREKKHSLNEGICREKQFLTENDQREPNFNQNSVISTPYSLTDSEITPGSPLDVPTAKNGTKLLEEENVWNVDDIFLPATVTDISLEPEFSTTGFIIGTKNPPQEISDASESATPTDFQTEESFNLPSPSHSHFGHKTVTEPIAKEEPFYSNQFSDSSLMKQQPKAYPKQLFDDKLDKRAPDSEFLSNQQPDNSFIFPSKISKTPLISQESIEIQPPENTAFKENLPTSQQQFPVAVERNKESLQQSLQDGKQFNNFEETYTERNTDISSETERIPYPSKKYLTKSEEVPFNQITTAGPPQVSSNLTLNERQLIDYDDQTSASGFSSSYSIPSAPVPLIKSTSEVTFDDEDNSPLQKALKEKAQAIDEFFTAQSVSEDNVDSLILNDSSPYLNQDVASSDDLSTFSISKPQTDPTTSTFSERFPIENPFYDLNDNQFLSIPTPKRPPFQVSNELPLLRSESQKSALYYSEKNLDESNIDEITDAELSSSSDQYQSVARPKSQSMLNYPEQYGNSEEAKYVTDPNFFGILVQPDSDVTTSKPAFQSLSATPEYQIRGIISFDEATSFPQNSKNTTLNQKFSSSQNSISNYESFSSSEREALSDAYPTTLPPKQDSFENFQKILTTFNPYQDQPDFRQAPFTSALEEKFPPTFPGQILNDDAISPTFEASTMKSEQSSNDIHNSPSVAPASSDDYQGSLYSKPHLQSSFTTPMQHFDENIYETTSEPHFISNQKSYSDSPQPTTPTISGINQLKEKPLSYSKLTLEQPLNYTTGILIPIQNYDKPKSRHHQFFKKSEASLTDIKPFSNQQYNDFSTESFQTKSSLNYDSQPDSFGPQMEQYSNDDVLISDKSDPNLDVLPHFAENFPEENRRIFSPQSFMPDKNKELFQDRSSFESTETTSSPVFSAADSYLEPNTTNNYSLAKLPKDTDNRTEKFLSELFTTPLPPNSFLPEDFSPLFNYRKMSGNSLTQNQVEESLTSLGQSVNINFFPKFEDPPHASLAPFRDVNKFDLVFPTEKNLKQSSKPATSEEKPIQSAIPVHESQSDLLFYYSKGDESFIPYAEKQVVEDPPKVQTVFFPDQKYFPKPPMSDLPEDDSITSSEEESSVEGSTESEPYYYNLNDSDNFGSHSAVDQQKMETIDQKSTLNSEFFSDFSDFSSKESSADFFSSLKRPLIQNSPDSFEEQTEFYLNDRQPQSQIFVTTEPSYQTLLEEYSDISPKAETEIPFDIDETSASTIPKAISLHANEQSESLQEKLSDYPFSFASEQQLKLQPLNDYTSDTPGKNLTEKLILPSPQTSNSENIPFFEMKAEKSITRDSYPNQKHTGKYEQYAAGVDYNQPKHKELDYLDESPNINSDLPVPVLSSPPQSLIASPPLDSDLNDFTPFPQSPASTSHQLNNNLNEYSQKRSDIPLRYPQSKKKISFITDNISPQPQPMTAVHNDEEKTEMLSTTKPQPQMSLNSADNSDDNIPKQLSDLPNQQYQMTPNAALSSELEPVPLMSYPSVFSQKNTMNFGTSDYDASSQPSFSFQSQAQQLDEMRASPYKTQNKFDPKLSSRVSNSSPLYTGTAIQILSKPSLINSEYLYNSQEQLPPYNQPGSQPDFNNGAISVEYQQDHSIQPVDRFSSNDSPREYKYFNEAFQYRGPQSLTAPKYGPRGLNPREEFQIQPSSRYPTEIPPINGGENRSSSVASKHLTIQRSDPQLHPTNFSNQNYNARASLNVPIRNLNNNEPARQTNRASLPQYFRSNDRLIQNSFESPLLFNVYQYSKESETERLPDQTIKNADSSSYDDYDQAQLPNEKLLEYDEDITPDLYAKNSQIVQSYRQQEKDMVEEKSQSSNYFLTEVNSPLGFNRQADTYDFQDRSSPNNKPSSYPLPAVEKEPHSNPLLRTLESQMTFPFEEHLRPSVSYASSTDSEKESQSHSFSFDPQHQNEFRDSSAIPSYSEVRDSESDIVNYQRSQRLNEVHTAQDVTNIRQPDSQVLVSDPNIPSNEPGEDFISCSGENPTPLLCSLDSILKGNMTAPSYYILISKLPVDNDKEEQFKVEKVYLGDGMPLNCTLSTGKTFPTSLYTPIPFSAPGTVNFRTKSDFA